MKPLDFFAEHSVFTHGQFVAEHAGGGRRSEQTSNNLLAMHLAAGRVLRIRRGLYASVPYGADPETMQVDPYLVASMLTDDAVIAFHAALQFHGKSYSLWQRFHFLTVKRTRPFRFRGAEFIPVQVPTTFRSQADFGGGVANQQYAGGAVRVTTLERTLVDLLDNPAHGGSWEEIWRSLEAAGFFDLDAVVEHALRLGSALTIARVGFFLQQHQDEFMVEDRHLKPLRELAPKQPRYFDRKKRDAGKLLSEWNLVVPDFILNRSWSEVL